MFSHLTDTAEALRILHFDIPDVQGVPINAIDGIAKTPFPKIKGIVIHLSLKPGAIPVQVPWRRTPIALENKIKLKLDELEQLDIIEKVDEPSQWVSALVPVVKNDGDIRLCVDLRRLNEAIERELHPLPNFEDSTSKLCGAKFFSKFDIKSAYHQCELDEESRPLTTFITQWGRYRYKRLVFGVSCAPEKFQKLMEQILNSCSNVIVFIDDVLVYGRDEAEHDRCVEEVLRVLDKYGVLLNTPKCEIKVSEIVFLGHRLTPEGIYPTEDKLVAIQRFRAPQTKEELRSFLGLACYVSKFIPDMATITHPLRELLKKDVKYKWESDQQHAFEKIKNAMVKPETLAYYDPKCETRLVADASPVGIGAVFIQFRDKEPRIIAYAAKSLTETEQRYCQSEKEALALVWSVERFRTYLLGITFELETDHQALETIFGPTSRPCARIERWVLRLQAFRFKVKYRRGKANLADPLSRLTVMEPQPFDEESEAYINEIKVSAAVDIVEVELASESDPIFKWLRQAIDNQDFSAKELEEFKYFRNELAYVGNLVLRGMQIVIPQALRGKFLELGHEGHPGESAMKRRLRSKCWWPQMDKEITKFVKKCQGCLLVSTPNQPEPMTRRNFPISRWIDIAIDFLGPLPTGEHLLVIIDYYSRYKEVKIMRSITADATIEQLDEVFIRLGYPHTITLDNGRQFVSSKFKEYCEMNNIHLNHTAPYWPQANGLVERQNRTLLKRLRIGYAQKGEWKSELKAYMMMYNTTPHPITDKTPTELMYGETIRSKIPQFKEIERTVVRQETADRDKILKEKGKDACDNKRKATESNVKVGDLVLQKNMFKENKLSTTFNQQRFRVVNRNGPVVVIQNEDTGEQYERNVAHIKKIPSESEEESSSELIQNDMNSDDSRDEHTIQMSDEDDFLGFTDDEQEMDKGVIPDKNAGKKILPVRNRRIPKRYL